MQMKRLLTLIMLALAALPALCRNDKPLRLAVAGVTHDHLWNVANAIGRGDFEVVGVWETNDNYRQHNILTGKVSEKLFYKDLDRMLDRTHPEAVVAYGPIAEHLRVVEACAPRHIHVMVEKPLATTYAHAQRIQQLASRYGIMVLTNYETSWYATNHQAKSMIEAGKIGRVFRINVYDGHEGPIEINCSERFTNWLTDPVQNGGGAVIDFGCYGINLATWLFGNRKPVGVTAVLRQNKPDVYPRVDDDATILLNYPQATVSVMGSWCWPAGRKDMYIYGLGGTIYQRNSTDMELSLRGRKPQALQAPALSAPLDDSFRYLRAAVRGEIKVLPTDLASIENNLIVVQILEAAIRSSRTGQTVTLAD